MAGINSLFHSIRWFYVRECLAGMALVALLGVAAMAEESASKTTAAASGNIALDCPDAPRATFELDLSQGMFQDLFGIGDAAIAGAVESLKQSAGKADGKESHLAAEQLEAVRQLVQLSGNLVQGVRVRVYELGKDKTAPTDKFLEYYGKKLHTGNWETVFRVHDDDQSVDVSVVRSNGSIKGLFIIGTDYENLILANVVCDVSPENMKKLGAAIANSGLQDELGQALQIKICTSCTRPAEVPADTPAEKP